MAAEPTAREGAYLVGVLEGQRPANRTYTDRDGNEKRRHEVGVRCGDDVVAVSYPDAVTAEKHLAELGASAGETVQIPVQYRLIKKLDGTRPYAFLSVEADTGEARDLGWR